MLASALVPAYAIAVLMPAGPDDGCPSPRQVTEALDAHLPGIVAPLGHPIGGETLRLGVTTDPSGATDLYLTDAAGDLLLRRQLPLAARGRGGDCPALAETVALIVERYWREIGSDVRPVRPAPPPAPPEPPATPAPEASGPTQPLRSDPTGDTLAVPENAAEPQGPAASVASRDAPRPSPSSGPRARLALGAAMAGRGGDTGDVDASAVLVFSGELSVARWRLGFRVSGGVSNSRNTEGGGPAVGFRHLPLRLGGYLPIPIRVGQLEPGAGLVLDGISVRATDGGDAASRLAEGGLCSGQLCASPGGDLALGWSVRLPPHVYIRALSRVAVVVPYRFATTSGATVWSTPRTYLELGLEWGVWF